MQGQGIATSLANAVDAAKQPLPACHLAEKGAHLLLCSLELPLQTLELYLQLMPFIAQQASLVVASCSSMRW